MAKKTHSNPSTPSDAEKGGTSNDDVARIAKYQEQYESWFDVLTKYHVNRFDKNYRQYTAYTSAAGTHAKISDPVAPELIERVIQKMFERDPKFYAMARGHNLPMELVQLMSSVADYLWTHPMMVQTTGTMRSKLKVIGREFLVTGNTAVESYYNGDAETTDARSIPIEDVVFDPTLSLKKSKRHYVKQFVDMDYLESMKEVKKDGKKDGKIVSGIFKNIDKLKAKLEGKTDQNGDTSEKMPNDPTPNWINRSGSNTYDRPVDEILLITVYEGTQVTRIADWEEIIQDVDDPLGINASPLDFAMDIEVPKQPYAFSMLDFINGLTQAKDVMLNQVIDYGSKALNPPLFADPSIAPINKATLRNAWKTGGLVFANPSQVSHLNMPPLPQEGFAILNYIQQRAESASGIGAYTSGVPNQTSDKTQGTKGGIEALINQAISPIHDRQQTIEESIVEPMMNKWMKLTAYTMGKDETKWVFVTGQSPKWVELTRDMLLGNIKLNDMVTAGMLQQPEADQLAAVLKKQGKDPKTEVIFDVEWVLRVETGSMADIDSEKSIQALQNWVQFNAEFGVPMDLVTVSKEFALRSGLKNPDQFLQVQQPPAGTPIQGPLAAQNQPQQGPPPPPEPQKGADPQALTAKVAAEAQQTASETQTKAALDSSQIELNRAKAQVEILRAQALQGPVQRPGG